MDEHLILFTSILLLGIGSQWLAWKLRLPSILLLLGFGFLAGQFYDQSEIIEQSTLLALVSLSVGVILLEGGLSLKFSELKEAGPSLIRLLLVGTLVTWVLSTLSAHYLAGFSWPVAILVAAILVVTGPTVIGPLLRSVKPSRRVNLILKWEGIVIDPVGAVLAVLVFGVLFDSGHSHDGGSDLGHAALGLLKTLLIGGGLGWGAAMILASFLRRHWIPDYLQAVVILTVTLGLFTLSNFLQHESGLVTATVLGIGLANQKKARIRHVIEFKETVRTILISCLFIVLGGRIGWQEIVSVWKEALLFFLALVIVVRPASVFLATIGSKRLDWKEKLFISFMAPRGIVAAAVSSVFALELAKTGGPYAEEAARIGPIAFTVIVGTVALYGLFSGPLARKLGLAVKNPQGVLFVGIRRWSIEAALAIQEAGFRVLMLDSNYSATAKARMAGVQAVNANILSDFAAEEIDLSGIGYMAAVTPNDQVNSLACIALGHTLGSSNVFQFKAADLDDSERKAASSELMGRFIGSTKMDSLEVIELEKAGAAMKQTLLSDEFGMKEFRELYGEDALVLFVLHGASNSTLAVYADGIATPVSGDTLISLVVDDSEPVIEEPEGDGPKERLLPLP